MLVSNVAGQPKQSMFLAFMLSSRFSGGPTLPGIALDVSAQGR
jgi:hypothetical protein